ncbi:unnamed protein product [Aphis gossypii]|uniref:Uncharacterized protein n=1 Tax=Aphis gossypii TaxID=80765 RepID=A0A9P0ISQ6_APHGO|nr:unnamed protein product [Aphis gossypii]
MQRVLYMYTVCMMYLPMIHGVYYYYYLYSFRCFFFIPSNNTPSHTRAPRKKRRDVVQIHAVYIIHVYIVFCVMYKKKKIDFHRRAVITIFDLNCGARKLMWELSSNSNSSSKQRRTTTTINTPLIALTCLMRSDLILSERARAYCRERISLVEKKKKYI